MPTSITVKDHMTTDLVSFTPDMEILRAAQTLVEHRIAGAPVIDLHGNLVGMISEMDCVRVALHASYYEEYGGKVSEYMTKEVTTVDADTSIAEVAQVMVKGRYRRLPVMYDNRLVGQISAHDVLKALGQLW